jgi:hypothetical protein
MSNKRKAKATNESAKREKKDVTNNLSTFEKYTDEKDSWSPEDAPERKYILRYVKGDICCDSPWENHPDDWPSLNLIPCEEKDEQGKDEEEEEEVSTNIEVGNTLSEPRHKRNSKSEFTINSIQRVLPNCLILNYQF